MTALVRVQDPEDSQPDSLNLILPCKGHGKQSALEPVSETTEREREREDREREEREREREREGERRTRERQRGTEREREGERERKRDRWAMRTTGQVGQCENSSRTHSKFESTQADEDDDGTS